VLAALLLGACASVGPDYRQPAFDAPTSWQALGADTSAAPAPAATLAAWWQQLGDATLDALIADALAASPDLAAARARLRESRAQRGVAAADRYPTVDLSASRTRSSSSRETGSGSTRDLYSAAFDASWEPDVFGGVRRGVEAADADLAASAANLDDARVTLVAEVALNYVELRTFQAQLAIARSNLASQSETLQITDWRAQAGLTTTLDVEQARASREQTRATIPSLQTSLAGARHRIAILLGKPPAALDDRLAAVAPLPQVPRQVAVGIPADALRQRPDVRAAERSLAAAVARVGEAQAARYPSFRLSGSIGLEALSFGALSGSEAITRSLLAGITAPIFDAGRLRQQVEVRDAQREQAEIAYRQALLSALEDVENALAALDNSHAREEALGLAADAARNAAELARQRYSAGLTDFQTVLDTERSLLGVEDSLAVASANRATALIQLYKALGGGWSPLTRTGNAS
jgi:NodT family efflux transporter outer membrane factor (OMF) lipoprotein